MKLIEKKYQKIWQEERLFEANCPPESVTPTPEKFMASMAYPYMNGVLHVGHSFTLSKVEFAVGFEKMRGKNTLFPLGFHCTGMPIRTCADKLAREAEVFGQHYTDVPLAELGLVELESMREEMKSEDGSCRYKGKKTKTAVKEGHAKYQFEIMLQLGIPREEIYRFADPQYWLEHFPPLCQRDCTNFGARIDWRRSMITTDLNPFYDQFVRWQIQRLKDIGRIKFGERYTIYSVKDNQPCMDHDRQSGEGITPKEYTAIKVEVLEFSDKSIMKYLDNSKKVILIATTLRPETLYGQTGCCVSPLIDYGIYDNGPCYYITTEQSYKNMSYQKLTPNRGQHQHIALLKGSQLIGSRVHSPLAYYKELHVLPMNTILENKATGVVACVPSDSPDDFIHSKELRNKPERYGIKEEWILEPITIINTKYGDQCAPAICNDFNIRSSKQTDRLTNAKEAAYKEGLNSGIMLVGDFKGEKLEVARQKIKDLLLKNGLAFVYSEPEVPVVSRSGDYCVVSLEDQWYVDYGEPEWKSLAFEALHRMKNMNQTTMNAFESVLDWLKNWAVCRTYGLGTRLPWDEKFLVESLSDSTMYQAYYTICHLLHKDFYGAELSDSQVTPERMTPEVFDYIFLHRDNVETDIPIDVLQKMRSEFEYFYPLDVSISGKDLIPNHLTFFIYTHAVMFPPKYWPTNIRVNGHLLLNNHKMSKSTGNFLTLQDILQKYGADASRIALADAGDTVDDANFEESTANSAILRLHTLKEWCEDIINGNIVLRSSVKIGLLDKCFENEMKVLVGQTYNHFAQTNYKMALRSGFFDFQALRDFYRDTVDVMNRDLVMKYIELQTLILTPIVPHFCEYIWRELLGHDTSVQVQTFPKFNDTIDVMHSMRLNYVRSLLRRIREAELSKVKKKKNNICDIEVGSHIKIIIFIALDFPQWQQECMVLCKELYKTGQLWDMGVVKSKVKGNLGIAMPFIMHLIQRLEAENSSEVFNHLIEYNEANMIHEMELKVMQAPQFLKACALEIVHFRHSDGIVTFGNGDVIPISKAVGKAIPGEPVVTLQRIP